MAMNVENNGNIKRRDKISIEKRVKSTLKNPDSNSYNSNENEMGQKKKNERKRPELQIYRPGMGFQHRNKTKSEENVDSLSIQNLNLENCVNSDDAIEKELPINSESFAAEISSRSSTPKPNCPNDSKSNMKNRRPDKPVYMPKSRIAAKFKNVTNDESLAVTDKQSECEPEKPKSKRTSQNSRKSIGNVGKTNSKSEFTNKVVETKCFSKSSFGKKNDELVINDSCGSRSTPEGFSEYNGSVHSENIQLPKENSTKKNDVKVNLSETSINKPVANVKSTKIVQKSFTNSKYTSWAIDHNENYISDDDDDECWLKTDGIAKVETAKILPNDKDSAKSAENRPKISDNVKNCFDSKSKNVQKRRERKASCGSESGSTYQSHSEASSTSETFNQKSKRDRLDQNLPPRFQKQKEQSSPEQKSGDKPNETRGSSGILRLPPKALSPDVSQTTSSDPVPYHSYIPPHYSPPAQQFVHKQLFNPKNPNVPEIVNIPTVFNYGTANTCNDYVPTGMLVDPPLYPSSARSVGGYIPPPQPPPPIRGPYQFPGANFPPPQPMVMNGIRDPSYLATNLMPPVICANSNPRPVCAITPAIRPPVYANEFVIPQGNERKRFKPIVEKNLREISLLERELSSNLAKGLTTSDLNSLRQCRWKLQLRYENIILADPHYCAEKNAEQQLWKAAYYQIIETLRKNLEEQPENKELKENLLTLVSEGTVFYENLLEKQQETFGFSLSQLLEMENLRSHALQESLRLVLISSQKILIHLGDLARYREQANGTTNFGKARSMYLKAQQLAPKNGRPYHQLAVLALCARRKLDAVYFFMRSLAASNPFLSAREYLLSLFDDAKRKYELYEKKRRDDFAKQMEIISMDLGERNEVWIKPDGSKIQQDSVVELQKNDREFKKVSTVELNKRFVTSFLHVHGKLFTKVGMETFDEIVHQMLKEFYHLLQRSPFPLESSRLLQLSAINMFSVANTSLKDDCLDVHQNSLFQIQALNVCQSMMCLIMQRCTDMHVDHMKSADYPGQLIADDMAHLFPTVKIWSDWMSCQKELWHLCVMYSPNSKLGLNLDIWSSFAELLTVLRDVDTTAIEIMYEKKEGLEQVILDEDNMYAGFVPLLGALQEPTYVKPPYDKDRTKNTIRLNQIQFFGDYLCGIPTPYLEFDVEHKQFNSVLSSSSDREGSKSGSDIWHSYTDDSFGDESLDSDEVILDSSLDEDRNSEIKQLWSRKEALCRAKAQQDKHNARMQAVLRRNQSQRPMVLQIQPRYLIPDTNCFIDYLQELQELLSFNTFHIIVPLIVINELDGLARGMKENLHSTPEHTSKVTSLSRAAVLFLEQEFANRNPHIRAITSKGSIMDTISFRSEDVGRDKVRGTNDDQILSCCMFYCKDRPELYMGKDRESPMQLFREVVLLTDDRNLRVKALTQNVPARDLESFLKWAKS